MAADLGYDPKVFRPDAKGTLHAIDSIKAEHQLEDDVARDIAERAHALSLQLAEFRAWAMGEGDAFVDTLREKYGAKRGGSKGGFQIVSFDGSVRVLFTVQDRIEFGAELQVAKDLIDQCIREWSTGANANLVTIVQDAFKVDKKGQVSADRILGLRRHDIDDDTWRRAMEAISDSVRRDTSKRYIRVQVRNADGEYDTLPLDVASADRPVPKASFQGAD
jgi:hypothetical protein